MRRLAITVVVTSFFALAACSSAHEGQEHQPAPPPVAPPPVVLPDVQGVPALEDTNPDPNIVEVSLTAGRTTVEIDGKSVSMLGYNGVVPGPMLKAKVGDEVIVHFRNELSQPTTIHWHGLRIPDDMDGSPRLQAPVKPGEEFTYRFKVPEAGSFWYHPHVRANEQLEAGLHGPIVISDPKTDPVYDAERYLMVDDLLLDGGKRPAPFFSGMEAMHGRNGNVLLTNGRSAKDARAAAEQGTIERWRIVNTANARTMELGLEGASFRVIGTDGGLLAEPYTTKRLIVPVGQRFDLEVTYDRPGAVKLLTYVPTVNDQNEVVEASFSAFAVDVAASARLPREIVWPDVASIDRTSDTKATITLDAVQGGAQGIEWRMNGKAHSKEPLFTFAQGATVRMRLENKAGPEHPFHLHGQFFKILDKTQPGLKDTVLVPGMSTVEIVAYMDNPGRWMAHCHILEHAELGMMSEIIVTPSDGAAVAPPASGEHNPGH